jgi:hypothetical protein
MKCCTLSKVAKPKVVAVLSEWFKRFEEGCENVGDDPRSGRLPTSRNAETIANVRRWALRMMSDELTLKTSGSYMYHTL